MTVVRVLRMTSSKAESGKGEKGAILTTTAWELDPEGLEDSLDCLLNGEGWRAVEGPETEAIEERDADDGRGSLGRGQRGATWWGRAVGGN